MKIRKGLGSIPKSLAWIDSEQSMAPQTAAKEIEKKYKQKTNRETQKDSSIAGLEQETLAKSKEIRTLSKSCTSGLQHGWTRATFIVSQEIHEALKAVAYWERITLKEVIHDALNQYMKNKNVRPIPKKNQSQAL